MSVLSGSSPPRRTTEDELALTLEARMRTLAPDTAATIARSPTSTIEPPRPDVDSRDNVALRVLESLARRGRREGAGEEGAADAFRASFTIERTLGEGGMGLVHLATQVVLGRKVAVKTLRPESRDGTSTLKLVQEAWVTGALERPSIVPVYDIAVDASGGPVIVLKRIEGRHWGAVMHDTAAIDGAKDPLEWNLRVLLQVCNAVHFAHSRGIIHRDLKPENVMVGGFGEIYVLDWGLAVSVRDDADGRLPLAKDATELAGTPCYMAPEMLGGLTQKLSERTDVYLLGAILFEILTGRPPHLGEDLKAIMVSVLLSPPQVPEGVPQEAARICQRAMELEPSKRYASADELRRALEAFLQHRGSMLLADGADRSLVALLGVLRAGKEASPERVYNLLGECRFGYRAAADAWTENDEARRGLERALEAVAEHELELGDARAAAVLLGEMASPKPALAQKLDEVRRAGEFEAKRVAALHALGENLDPKTGARTRVFIGALLGVIWIVTPAVADRLQASSGGPSHGGNLAANAAFLAVALALGVWARESLTKTLLNRRLFASLVFTLAVQLVFAVGASSLGVSPVLAQTLHLVIWMMVSGMLAIHVDARFAIPNIADIVAFYVVARYPERLYLAMSLVSVALAGTIMWIWWPLRALTPRRPPSNGGAGRS